MSPTKPDKNRQLSPEQETAIDLILAGQSDRDVAAAVNRTRQTIGAWRQQPMFAAALNARRVEIWGNSSDRLRRLLPRAIEVVEDALNKGDLRTAFRIIELAGFKEHGGLGPSTIGPVSPGGVEAEQRRQEHMEFLELLLAGDGPAPLA
jgi:hypothetical protein